MQDAKFYDQRVAEKYPTSDNPEMDRVVTQIHEWCSVEGSSRVLDFGCFDGYTLRALRRRVDITGVGVDISADAVRLAAELTKTHDLQFIVADGVALPFPDGHFDVVVCSEILEHVPDLDAVLSELARVLRVGGRLYATMPNSLVHVFPPLRPLCRRVDRIEGHVRRLTKDDFLEITRRHGFEPLRTRYRGFVFSALWYGTVIYNPRIKHAGISMITDGRSRLSSLAKRGAFAAMRFYLAADGLFGLYQGCMGIDAAFVKSGTRD
jgi:SAM-dependent methyltransferase